MVSFTHFFAKRLNLRHGLLSLLVLMITQASAADLHLQKTEAHFFDNRIEVSCRTKIILPPPLQEALHRGAVLPFIYEFQMTRPRYLSWLQQISDWFEPTATLDYQLSFHPLTSQYRITSGGFNRSFTKLEDALAALSSIRGWIVITDTSLAHSPSDFAGKVRFRLALNQMPKPYQMTAIGNADWRLESPWTDVVIVLYNSANTEDNGL